MERGTSISSRSDSVPTLYYHKVCLVGDAGVGKTSLFLRIRNGMFSANASSFNSPADTHRIVRKHQNNNIGMCLHDPGRESGRHGTLTANFYRGAKCVVVIFSVADKYTLESIDDAIAEAKVYTRDTPCHYVLVGTKNDIGIEDEQFETVINEKRDKLGFKKVFFISSKTGEGIDQLLDHVVEKIDKLAEEDEEKIQLEGSAVNAHSQQRQSKCIENCTHH